MFLGSGGQFRAPCFVCNGGSWQDPCVLSTITHAGPKAWDGISQLELMSSGHLQLNTLQTHCVCFVCRASAEKPISSARHEFLKDLKAVNNSKPSLTRFTPGALCNLSGLPCASSNAGIMLECKSLKLPERWAGIAEERIRQGLANIPTGAWWNKQYSLFLKRRMYHTHCSSWTTGLIDYTHPGIKWFQVINSDTSCPFTFLFPPIQKAQN